MPAAVEAAMGGKEDEAGSGGLAQDASRNTVAIIRLLKLAGHLFATSETLMTVLFLEALGALLLLVFIVWWTMFSGRKKGELKGEPEPPVSKPGADKK
jgi:hypothetical protein